MSKMRELQGEDERVNKFGNYTLGKGWTGFRMFLR